MINFSEKIVFVLFLCFPLLTYADKLAIRNIEKSILIGEVYPSGNLYLKMFTPLKNAADLDNFNSKSYHSTRAPEKVKIYCISSEACNNPAVSKMEKLFLRAKDVSFNENTYLPAMESMVDKEDTQCVIFLKKNFSFRYLDEDFFRTAFDYCYFDDHDEIISYHTIAFSNNNLAYKVIAIASNINLINIIYFYNDEKRTLTADEKKKIDRQKSKYKKENDVDCATVPTYLDAAKKILEADIAETPFKLSLASYINTGCGGHMTIYYILDISYKNAGKKTYVLTHYVGPV